MTSLELKFLVYERWGSITAAAKVLECSRSQLSYCISRRRVSRQLREKLARALDKPIDQLFSDKAADSPDDSSSPEEIEPQPSESESSESPLADSNILKGDHQDESDDETDLPSTRIQPTTARRAKVR
ncbi:MAG: hypothetical protein DMF61_09805 [Blastocatellia bacterium AA13]|nr:MAG: hypothetical protein DMF61_09805 [Blastocatellia bacterium AA13]